MPETTDPRPFADLRDALAASTPGKWDGAKYIYVGGPDTRFTALAHNLLPAVLARLDAAEAERDKLMGLLVREVVREDTDDGSTEWIASWPSGHDWFESWHDTRSEAIAKVAAHAGLAPAATGPTGEAG